MDTKETAITAERPKLVKDNDTKAKDMRLKELMIGNLRDKQNMWPGICVSNYSPFYLLFFIFQIITLCTGFTFFLERAESHDKL